MKKILFLLSCSYMVCAFADGMTALDEFLSNKHSNISANFKQIVLGQKANQVSSGMMKIARPNRFIWQYASQGNNIGQLMLSDGKKIYIVDKELEQVTIKNLNTALDKSPASILAGSNDIKHYYNVVKQADSDGMEWVLLTPKQQNDNNGFDKIAMGFNKFTHLLQQMKFTSNLGSKTQLEFSNLQMNARYKVNEFNYQIPKNYDVIDGNSTSLGK